MNNERAAAHGKARAIAFRGDDARLDLEPRFPKGVALGVGKRIALMLRERLGGNDGGFTAPEKDRKG